MKTIIIASVVVAGGWFTGRMMHSFVEFVIEFNKKHNDKNPDE
jgi:hypothetical protein